MAEQYLPDTFGAMTGAFNAGRLIKGQRQQAQQRQQLSALAPAVLNGDPSATAQAYAIDPEAAKQYGEGAERIGLQLHNIANQIKQMHASGNEQGAAMLYSQAAPMIRQKFPNAPAQWDPASLMPAIDAVVAMTSQGDTQQRNLAVSPGSAIVDPQTGRVVYERPFAPANTPLVDVPDGQGGMVKMAYDPKTQQLSMPQYPGQGGAPQGAPQNYAPAPDISMDMLPGADVPPSDEVAMLAAAQNPGQAYVPQANGGALPQGAAPQAPRMGYTPPKADKTNEPYQTMTPEQIRGMGLPEGTVAQVSPAGQVQIVNKPRDLPAGGQVIDNGDGTTTYIPAGKLSDAQRNNAGFYDRMVNADGELTGLEAKGYDPTNLRDYMTVGGKVLNGLSSPEGQQYHQAAQNWVRANLRKESGAAIGVKEMDDEIRNYFPVFGDGQEVVQQKAHNRQVVEQAMRTAAGGAIAPHQSGQPAQGAQQSGAPAPGAIEDGHRFKGGNPADPNNWEAVR